MSLDYGDLCGRVWETAQARDAGQWEAMHKCRRLDGHSSEHVCSCGARLDERLSMDEVPD